MTNCMIWSTGAFILAQCVCDNGACVVTTLTHESFSNSVSESNWLAKHRTWATSDVL